MANVSDDQSSPERTHRVRRDRALREIARLRAEGWMPRVLRQVDRRVRPLVEQLRRQGRIR